MPPGNSALQSSSETTTTTFRLDAAALRLPTCLALRCDRSSPWTVQPAQSSSPGRWLRWSVWCQRSTCNDGHHHQLHKHGSSEILLAQMNLCGLNDMKHCSHTFVPTVSLLRALSNLMLTKQAGVLPCWRDSETIRWCSGLKESWTYLSTICLYLGISRAYSSLLMGESCRNSNEEIRTKCRMFFWSYLFIWLSMSSQHSSSSILSQNLKKKKKKKVKQMLWMNNVVLTLPSLCSAMVQESMNVWAMTESTASTWSDACTSKINWGFFTMLIQKRSGRLETQKRRENISGQDPDWASWPNTQRAREVIIFLGLFEEFQSASETLSVISWTQTLDLSPSSIWMSELD